MDRQPRPARRGSFDRGGAHVGFLVVRALTTAGAGALRAARRRPGGTGASWRGVQQRRAGTLGNGAARRRSPPPPPRRSTAARTPAARLFLETTLVFVLELIQHPGEQQPRLRAELRQTLGERARRRAASPTRDVRVLRATFFNARATSPYCRTPLGYAASARSWLSAPSVPSTPSTASWLGCSFPRAPSPACPARSRGRKTRASGRGAGAAKRRSRRRRRRRRPWASKRYRTPRSAVRAVLTRRRVPRRPAPASATGLHLGAHAGAHLLEQVFARGVHTEPARELHGELLRGVAHLPVLALEEGRDALQDGLRGDHAGRPKGGERRSERLRRRKRALGDLVLRTLVHQRRDHHLRALELAQQQARLRGALDGLRAPAHALGHDGGHHGAGARGGRRRRFPEKHSRRSGPRRARWRWRPRRRASRNRLCQCEHIASGVRSRDTRDRKWVRQKPRPSWDSGTRSKSRSSGGWTRGSGPRRGRRAGFGATRARF